MTQNEIYKKVKEHSKFKELVKKRGAFVKRLSLLIFIFYFIFILAIAFYPKVLGVTVGGSLITVGIVLGIFIIVLSFLVVGIYTKKANFEFDTLVAQIKQDIRLDV